MKRPVPTDVALVEMHRGSHTTIKGAASILRYVRDHGLPTAVSESSQRRARQHHAGTSTPFGPVVQELVLNMADGRTDKVWVSHPFALLYRTVAECPPFKELMLKKLQQFPCSVQQPWGLIIYFDEVSPTDPLSNHTDERQIQSFYWTFYEFADIVFHEEVWFVVTCARSVTVNDLEVGMSELVKEVVCIFLQPRLTPFRNLGSCS